MNKPELGRLKKVDLRTAWLSEPGDFTPWLAEETNLRLLGETIGIELELEAQEQWVGPFRADLLCKDTTTDNWVLIENQLERTDHTHLGQLITYAAGLNAVTIVWIAKQFSEEHRAAMDWLNERTDEKINLFGLEIELWQIGDSAIAPKFNVISQPNDWSRKVQIGAVAAELDEASKDRLRFWTAFKDFLVHQGCTLKSTNPSGQYYMNFPLGRSGIYLSAIRSNYSSETKLKTPELRVDLYLQHAHAKDEFDKLLSQQSAVEQSLGFPLTWLKSENQATCRIFSRVDADFRDDQLWPQQFAWLHQRLEAFHKVFAPLVKELKRADTAVGQEPVCLT